MYRKHLLFAVLLSMLSFFVQAQDSTKLSKIYFIRSTGMSGGFGPVSAFIDEELVCKLNNNRFSVHYVQPGAHKFKVQYSGKKANKKLKALEFTTEAGQTYYISLDVTNYAFSETLYPIEITENTFKRMLPKLRQDENCL